MPTKLAVDPNYRAPDYFQPDFPVLSFLYALYTDAQFSKNEHAIWFNTRVDGKPPYFGYLDNYDKPAGSFPAEAKQAIGVGVPGNGADSAGFYYPTPVQASVGIQLILQEITKPPARAPRTSAQQRSLAQLAGDRPILRILGALFLNLPDDPGGENIPAMIEAAAPNATVAALLTRFVGDRHAALQAGEADALTLALIDEFIAAPPKW